MENNNVISAILDSAFRSRTPLTCSLEITKKCNFNCIHCYLRDNHLTEMEYEEVIAIISQIKKAGTLFLNLTGGEIMLHPKFFEIYSYAYKEGMIITLLTNGSVLNEKIRELLFKKPPRKIEITVYGGTQDVFKRVTGSSTNFNLVFENIEKLKKDGHNILLKMIVIKENRKDFELIREYALRNNIPFQYDFNILPTLLGNRNVMEHELTVDEAIALEVADGKKANWKTRIENYDVKRNKKISCGCGRFSYAISSDKLVKKCTFMEDAKEEFFLDKGDFVSIWSRWKEENTVFGYNECQECKFQAVCDVCPSISYMLSEDRDGVVKRQCELARRRYELAEEKIDS